MPAFHLVVTRPFDAYKRGDRITDPERIKEVLASEHANHVVRAAAPDEAEPVKE